MSAPQLPPVPEARVLPFRRPSSAVRVRRRNPWLALGRHFLQALVLVGAPAALALWLLSSPTFALAAVEVAGNRHVEARWVERQLAPLVGENLIRLELGRVEELIAANPWVDGLVLEKRLPNRLLVVLAERQPQALLRAGSALSYLDGAGEVIAPFDPRFGPADLLLVSVATRVESGFAGALAVSAELAACAPEWAPTLSEVEVLGEGDFRLHLAALDFPLLVRAGTLAARLGDVARLLPELERRYGGVRFIDLRFDRRIVFQPAAREGSGEWPRQNSTS